MEQNAAAVGVDGHAVIVGPEFPRPELAGRRGRDERRQGEGGQQGVEK